MRDVQGKKGEFKVKYKSEARDKERKSQLEQMVFAGEMAQNQQKAEGDAAALKSSEKKSRDERRSREKIARGSQGTTRRGQDMSSTDRKAAEAGRNARDDGPKGKGPSKAKRQATQEDFDKAMQITGSQPKPKQGKGNAFVSTLLQSGVKNAWVARAATEIRVYGKASPRAAAVLKRRYGLKVRAFKKGTEPARLSTPG